jgi:YHS domain-containing protein
MKNLKLTVAIVLVAVVAGCKQGVQQDVVPAGTKPDLLATCPVSGDKLGDMGKPYVFVYQGQEVKLCCPDCKEKFDKEPEKYLKLIRAADPAKK